MHIRDKLPCKPWQLPFCHHASATIIMSTFSCHVYEGHTDWVSLGLITCTSPLTAITFCQVSPNPMAVQKPISLPLKKKSQRT